MVHPAFADDEASAKTDHPAVVAMREGS